MKALDINHSFQIVVREDVGQQKFDRGSARPRQGAEEDTRHVLWRSQGGPCQRQGGEGEDSSPEGIVEEVSIECLDIQTFVIQEASEPQISRRWIKEARVRINKVNKVTLSGLLMDHY